MVKAALTDARLRKLSPSIGRQELTDAGCAGLRLRISENGAKTFILKARDASSQLQTVTLGRYPDLSLKQAREEATKAKLALKAGRNINAEKRSLRVKQQVASDTPTLHDLIIEFEKAAGTTKQVWSMRGPKSTRSGARSCIERVFANLLTQDVTLITAEEFAGAMATYRRVRLTERKATANGQVSHARAYLMPVLDWAAGRRRFAKIGAARPIRLLVANLAETHDPAVDDKSITGKRERVLIEEELRAVLPLLTYPAPQLGKLRLAHDKDLRPLAMRFLLFTAARLDEVCDMRWRDLNRNNKVWHKPHIKSTRGGPRSQDLPLSTAAYAILESHPKWSNAKPEELVFANGTGGKLQNWTRFQTALNTASKTSNWHRHDLRRTSATLMRALKVPASIIEQILGHADPLKGEKVGGAASHYMQLTRILINLRDPQEEALGSLADALLHIEGGNGVSA